MQIDFRDVYASILKDWFEVDPMDIQPLFEQTINYIDVLGACNLGIAENEKEDNGILIYPNPATSNTILKIETQNERVKIEIYDLNGRSVLLVCDKQLNQGTHQISCETIDLKAGEYIVKVFKSSGILSTKLSKIK